MPTCKIGSLLFTSKSEAERYIRDVLEVFRPVGTSTRKIDGSFTKFLEDLLDLHPNKDIVVGSGVKAYYCQRIDRDALRFLIERTDGSAWDFSWRNCLSPATPARNLNTVLRFEIQPQIDEFRKSIQFPVKCPVSGVNIHNSTCHIDHAEPNTFAVIVAKWLNTTGYSPDSIEILHKDKYGARSSIKDRGIAQQWKNYHRSNSSLRAVSVKANLSLLRKGR